MTSISNNSSKRINFPLTSLFVVFIIFVLWELLSLAKNDSFLFPSVISILNKALSIVTNISHLKVLFTTLLHVIIVISLSLFVVLLCSFIYVRIPKSIKVFTPLNTIIKAIPFAIISVYVFFAFKRSFAPYLTSFMVIVPLMFEGIISAIDNIDKTIIDELKMLEITSVKKFTLVYLPMCLPYIIMTIFQSFGLGLKVMIMAEYICQIEGTIGMVLVNTKYAMEFDLILGWLIVIVLLVSLMDLLVKVISKRLRKA